MIKSYLTLLAFWLLASQSAIAQLLSIDTCYALAVKNYPLIKQYELIEKTREYTISNANKAYLPQVSINVIEGYVFGGFPSLGGSGSSSSNFKFIGIGQINQTLWDGGATKAQKKIISASSEADKAALDVQLYDLRSRINQLYFGILLVDEQLKQLGTQDTILGNNINRVKDLKNNGLAYSTDLDEIKAEQVRLRQQRIEFTYTRKGYVDMLSIFIGVEINAQTALQKPLLSDASAEMQINRPELSLYKSQRSLLNEQSSMRRVALMPKLGLLGAGVLFAPGISLGPSTLNNIGVAGLNASWSLNGLYKHSAEKQLTQQSLNMINVQEESFMFQTRLKVAQVTANINKQKAILAEDNKIVGLRKAIREGYQMKYSNGVGPLIDLLNATEKESEARAQKALHEIQLMMTLYDFKTTTGN
jgi:outer membrane protein TolC